MKKVVGVSCLGGKSTGESDGDIKSKVLKRDHALHKLSMVEMFRSIPG